MKSSSVLSGVPYFEKLGARRAARWGPPWGSEWGSQLLYAGYQSAPGSARQDRGRPAQGSPRLGRPPQARSDTKPGTPRQITLRRTGCKWGICRSTERQAAGQDRAQPKRVRLDPTSRAPGRGAAGSGATQHTLPRPTPARRPENVLRRAHATAHFHGPGSPTKHTQGQKGTRATGRGGAAALYLPSSATADANRWSRQGRSAGDISTFYGQNNVVITTILLRYHL